MVETLMQREAREARARVEVKRRARRVAEVTPALVAAARVMVKAWETEARYSSVALAEAAGALRVAVGRYDAAEAGNATG